MHHTSVSSPTSALQPPRTSKGRHIVSKCDLTPSQNHNPRAQHGQLYRGDKGHATLNQHMPWLKTSDKPQCHDCNPRAFFFRSTSCNCPRQRSCCCTSHTPAAAPLLLLLLARYNSLRPSQKPSRKPPMADKPKPTTQPYIRLHMSLKSEMLTRPSLSASSPHRKAVVTVRQLRLT